MNSIDKSLSEITVDDIKDLLNEDKRDFLDPGSKDFEYMSLDEVSDIMDRGDENGEGRR